MDDKSQEKEYPGLERRSPERRQSRYVQLSEEDVEKIAVRAAKKAQQNMLTDFYQTVGQSVVKKFFVTVGLAAAAITAVIKGWIVINWPS